MSNIGPLRMYIKTAVLVLLCSMGLILAQDASQNQIYDVQFSKDEIYSYTDLKFTGDFAQFLSPKGYVALGRTQAGVTILIVIGAGTASIEAPDPVQDKFKSVFGSYPLKAAFNTIYMRLHPKEFEETFGKQALTKVADEPAFNAAKQLYDERFVLSYHAGARATLPPYKTRVMEFNTADLGLIWTEEGYWLTLRRYTPSFASIYPRDFVNPKQK